MTMTDDTTEPAAEATEPPQPPQPRVRSEGEVRLLLYRLTLDWIGLRGSLPIPTATGSRSSNVREYGHPAEWASDQCALIATQFWCWHEELAERRGETPPRPLARPRYRDANGDRVVVRFVPRTRRASHRTVSEQQAIVAAWKYLEPRIADLIGMYAVETESMEIAFDLHGQIRSRLGLSRGQWTLPMPCPRCELLTLQRLAGMDRDYVMCGSCGWSIDAKNYGFLVRMLADTLRENGA